MTNGSGATAATDEDLISAHVRGDPDAFGILVARHRDRLWAVALRTLGDPHDAADALQDALLNAFRRASSFRSESAVTTWLHRIVVNACLDRVRYQGARPADPVAFDGTEGTLAAGTGGGRGTLTAGMSDWADQATLRMDLERALAALSPEHRVPLVLVDVEGYPVAEVASLLGVPVGTVKSRCARARARLAALLTADGSGRARNRGPARGVPSGNVSGGDGQGGEHR